MIKNSLRGIRSKLIAEFLLSLFIALISGMFINSFVIDVMDDSYEKHFKYFDDDCSEYAEEIKYAEDDAEIKEIIEREKSFVNIFILNNDGNVIIKSPESTEKSFDIDILLNMKKYYAHTKYDIEYTRIIKIDDTRYIYFSKLLSEGDSMMIIAIVGIAVFSILFFAFTYSEIKYIKELSSGLMKIADGNLKYKVKVKGKDEISEIAQNINYMSEKLFKAKEEQQLSEEKKDLFIMNISHDLRTPLTSIIGYIELIKKVYSENKYENIKDYIEIALNKSYRLNKLINDFFEYNKINFGKVNLNKVKINLNEFLRQAATGMIPVLKEKDLSMNLSLPENEINVDIDPEQMYRVIENLIMNASKYSDCGTEVKIFAYEEKKKVIICVENICREFNYDKIKFIFDKFYKGDFSRSTRNDGAGLGLAIAKSIVEMHSGEISADYVNSKVKITIQI